VERAAEVSRLRREISRLGEVHEVTTPNVARTFEQGSVRDMERLMIEARLERLNQNRTHAAASLEISVRTLRNKLREYREAPRVVTPVEPR
jgi:two-component system response regulator FlrC